MPVTKDNTGMKEKGKKFKIEKNSQHLTPDFSCATPFNN